MTDKAPPRPKGCDEENCRPVVHADYDSEQPYSFWCSGFRIGPLKSKVMAVKNEPSDIFCFCILIGSHSEDCGIHRFIYNIEDFYLEQFALFSAMYEYRILRRTLRSLFIHLNNDIIDIIEEEVKRYRGPKRMVDIGTKFIEYFCSCGQIFFREYNEDHGDKYYEPSENDNVLLGFHHRLGHKIHFRKMERVEHSTGENRYWEIDGPHEYKGLD